MKLKGAGTMTAYVIEYKFEGKHHATIEMTQKGHEEQFPQQVLNRIESIVNAGAVVTALHEIKDWKE